MHEKIIAIFCICDEITKSFDLYSDPQSKMTTAEIMSFALISAMYYQGDYRTTRLISMPLKYFPKILSHSRLVRRIHMIPDFVWLIVFNTFKMYLRKSNSEYFVVDSFPVKAYENHKSFRAKIFRGKEFHGYTASKKQYFFGIKVHMIIDEIGIPIEFCFTPGSASDISGFKELSYDLPEGATIFADRAYNSYALEKDLLEMAGIKLIPRRKMKSTRPHSASVEFILDHTRNRIETVFSSITRKMPRCIRARTERGFHLKVTFFIIAYLCGYLSMVNRF